MNGSTMEIFKDAQSVTGSVALQRRLRASPSSHTMIRDHVAPWRTVALHRHPDRLFNHDLAGMTHNSWLQEQLFEDSRELVSRERIGRFCVDIMVVYLPVGASSLVAPLRDVE